MNGVSIGDLAAWAAVILTIFGLSVQYFAWRRAELRRSDVAAWGTQCIETTRKIHHSLRRFGKQIELSTAEREVLDDLSRLSALIDEGKIYFCNVRSKDPALHNWNSHRAPAYQNIRPAILDPLVACYDAATVASAAKAHSWSDLLAAFRAAEEQFVSLLQSEVGRARTASASAAQGGTGSPLEHFIRKATIGKE